MKTLSEYRDESGQRLSSNSVIAFARRFAKSLPIEEPLITREVLAEGFTLLEEHRIPAARVLVNPALIPNGEKFGLLWGADIVPVALMPEREICILGLARIANQITNTGATTPWAVFIKGEDKLAFSEDILLEIDRD